MRGMNFRNYMDMKLCGEMERSQDKRGSFAFIILLHRDIRID